MHQKWPYLFRGSVKSRRVVRFEQPAFEFIVNHHVEAEDFEMTSMHHFLHVSLNVVVSSNGVHDVTGNPDKLRCNLFWLEIRESTFHVRDEFSPSPFAADSDNL